MRLRRAAVGGLFLVLYCGTCSSSHRYSGDAVADADAASDVLDAKDGLGPDTVETREIDTGIDVGPLRPTLRLYRCAAAYEGCADVETLVTPYVRHDAWLIGKVEGGPTGKPATVSMQIGGEARLCDGAGLDERSCRVTFATLGLPETISVTVVVTYDDGVATTFEKNWTLPVFDCAVDASRSVCLDYGGWEAQDDVPITMPAWKCDYGCFEADASADGKIVIIAIESVFEAGDRCRVWLAQFEADAWSTQVLEEMAPDPTVLPSCRSPRMGITAGRDAVWITDALSVPGLAQDDAGHTLSIAEVSDAGIAFETIDLCKVCPADYPCPRGGLVNPVVRVGPDGTKHVFVATSPSPGLYLKNASDGWRCEVIRVPYGTGEWAYEVDSSVRMELGAGGSVHLAYVPTEADSVVYMTGTFGDWTDLVLPSGFAPQLALGVDDANRAHCVNVRFDATVMKYLIDHGVAISQEDLTAQAVAACKDNPSCHYPSQGAGQPDEYQVYPQDVALVTDSCRRDHVLIPSSGFETVYLTNLHGAWTGQPVPEFGSAEAGYSPAAPIHIFQTPNGDFHVVYLETYSSPQPLQARIRHWIRRCKETLVE